MPSLMKKLLLSVLSVLLSAGSAYADSEKAVDFDRIPDKAKAFLQEHFPSGRVSYAKQETDFPELTYEVMMTDGLYVEFDRHGEWMEIECRYGTLPVSVVPEVIFRYAETHCPGQEFRKISRTKKFYEVKFKSGMDLRFDRHFNFIGADD